MLLVNILHAYAIIIDIGRCTITNTGPTLLFVGPTKIITFEKNMGSKLAIIDYGE